MFDPLALPPARRRWLFVIASWALGLTATLWFTIGILWGALHFFIVPRIENFRPWLEQQASTALGVKVKVGAMQAHSNGLIPSIELHDVRLLDAQGRVALHLPKVLAALSPRSLFSRSFEQLYIEAPEVDVRRTLDGRLWIAGLLLTATEEDSGSAADWFFSQTELAVRHGTVRWIDETRSAPVLALSDVDVVVRNRNRRHTMRLDVTPPPEWGQRMTVMGEFRSPLLSRHPGDWSQWTGQLFASLTHVDLAQLGRYAALGMDVDQGQGALRAWVRVSQGGVDDATVDVALADVRLRAARRLPELSVSHVAGRLGAQRLKGGFAYFTESLAFATTDGLTWPGGNVRWSVLDATSAEPERHELNANALDLAAMSEIAQRFPIQEDVRGRLLQWGLKGQVDQLYARWQGPWPEVQNYAARGVIRQLEFAPLTLRNLSTPGVRGVSLDFDFTQAGGKGNLTVQRGAFDMPNVWETSPIVLDQLTGLVEWKVQPGALQISSGGLRFANSDAQGDVQFKWDSGARDKDGHGPGVLDLQASLSRLEINRIHRYLPRSLPHTREYLQESLLAGVAGNVRVKLKGDLAQFPFKDARQGEFRVNAELQKASYAYAPAYLQPQPTLPWPALTQLSADLAIDNERLTVRNAKGVLAGSAALQFSKTEAVVSRLYDDASVAVTAEARGPLADVVTLVNTSPIAGMTGKALAQTTASGNADYRLKLHIPLNAPERAQVAGSIALAGNDLQITSETPRMSRARGVIGFTETGFTVTGGNARALGSEVRIDGGMQFGATTPASRSAPAVLRIQGTATAEGLRQAHEMGIAVRLGRFATGAAPYSATLGWRAGMLDLNISSTLVGMGLSLPAPFAKGADASLPVRFEMGALRSPTNAAAGTVAARPLEQLQLEVGRLASVTYLRDTSAAEPRVVRGTIAAGLTADESAPMPAEGVLGNVNLAQIDLDAWSQLFGGTPAGSAGMAYLPNNLAVRAGEVTLGGRKIRNLVVGIGREGMLWRANMESSELSGYMEYRQPTGPAGGRLYARLARLVIGQSTAQEVESLLDEQPTGIPALDVIVEDFELRGRKLGRVEMDAVNSGVSPTNRDAAREWRLNRFNIITPEAVLSASGNWAAASPLTPAQLARDMRERRRTALNFKLEISDAGQLLERFGMKEVIRRGKGRMEGQISWQGSPITVDFASMAGSFNMNVENGQFLKTEPGFAKLLGVLSLQSLPRRLTLDFRDVFSDGFAFDFVRGDATIDQGIARTSNLQMKGVNAAVLMDGQADIGRETQSLRVVVIPEINVGGGSLIYSVINPVIGLSAFLANLVLRGPLVSANTQEFQIDGTWSDPRVTKIERKTTPTP